MMARTSSLALILPALWLAAGGTGEFVVPLAEPSAQPGAPRTSGTTRPSTLDGDLSDLAPSVSLPTLSAGPSSSVDVKVAATTRALLVGLTLVDDRLQDGDVVSLRLHFQDAGVTAPGRELSFGPAGERLPKAPTAGLRAAARRRGKEVSIELALAPQALPRFPARGPLRLDLCVEHRDRDGAALATHSTCAAPAGPAGPATLVIPSALRDSLALSPPPTVEAVEAVPGGFAGFSRLHFVQWLLADAALDEASLSRMVGGTGARAAGVPLSEGLVTPDKRSLRGVVTGDDPVGPSGSCDARKRRMLALYAVTGREAVRVVEMVAASCALGRVGSVGIDGEGDLVIGYTRGPPLRFLWNGDAFERTEIG